MYKISKMRSNFIALVQPLLIRLDKYGVVLRIFAYLASSLLENS